MKFEINPDIINRTICDKDFICLQENPKCNICGIKYCFENEFCLTENVKFGTCINSFYFGNEKMCNCPVRIAIYNKYGI